MNCLVIGYGSIGSKHARLLQELGCKVAIVSQHEESFPVTYQSVEDALKKETFDYIVIANQTNKHYETLIKLLHKKNTKKILVEKPLFHQAKECLNMRTQSIFVGYNLRFHPAMQELQHMLTDQKVLSAQIYVGQYLPDWRQNRDYRLSYSASNELGGGVLRDLSHELDYVLWLLGPWQRVAAKGGHYSHLEIKSDDVYHLLLETRDCPIVSIQLNYLDRVGRREIILNTDQHTMKADFVNHYFQVNNKMIKYHIDKDFTYLALHQAILEDRFEHVSSFEEGNEIMQLIDAAEKAAAQRKWIVK